MIERWLTGPVHGVDPLLMPAAHAFLQVRDDVTRLLNGLTVEQIWARPGASASIGYHALHPAVATDRLLTYARGAQLSETQLAELRTEDSPQDLDAAALVERVDIAVASALQQLKATPVGTLADAREVGRKRLPATVLGLIFHAAEHATRHAGQIATLRQVVTG
jgi:uncharacterized damage-inducible protein DinB